MREIHPFPTPGFMGMPSNQSVLRPPRKFRSFPFRYHAEIELRIESMTNQGHGLGRMALPPAGESGSDALRGRSGGWVVMVPFALPGELVRARVFRNHSNFSEADLIEVLEPSPERVEPPCPLFGSCGGCQYQNWAYSAQLEWKRRQVAELLVHLAGKAFPVDPVVPSPRSYRYRAKITPHFARPDEASGIGPIGFLQTGTRSRIIDVPECRIATDAVNRRLATARDELRRDPARFKKGATLLLREVDGGEVETDPNAAALTRVGPLVFEHLAGDFFQINPFILPAFVDFIVAEAAGSGARFLLDAYCGSGLFALSAAARFEAVAGVEIAATAVERARRNAARNRIGNAEFMAGAAEAIFARVGFPASDSAVIIDPPRAGCSDDFLGQIVTWRPRCCVYVSCNPATQMRDLRVLLAAGFDLARVQPFDLFPQTKHLECVITLRAGACPTS